MRKLNFFKTLLVAVGLCAGVNAWGEKGDVTTNVDIDFSNAITGKYSIAGTVGSMTWTNQWTYTPTIVDGIFRFGNFDGGSVVLQNNNIKEKDIVNIKFEIAFGKLSGKHVGFTLNDTDDNTILTQWFDAYNGDFDDSNPLNLNWDYMYKGNNTVIQERCVYFDITFNYETGVITTKTKCYLSGTGKAATNGEFYGTFSKTKKIGKFILQGNINNADRYSTIDNLKITTTEGDYTAASTEYTINYKLDENIVKTVSSSSSVGSNITADVAVNGEGDYVGKHYLITAAEAPSMTLTSGTNVLNVPVRAPYTATLTVTRNIGGEDQTPVVTNLTESDGKVCSWAYAYPMYVEKDGVYYVADETASFGESGVFTNGQTINKTVSYTNPDYSVVYFGEPNEVAGTNVSYSNANTGYITGGVVYTDNRVIRLGTLPAGEYHFITNVTGNAGRNVVVGNCTDTSVFPTALVTITTTGIKDEVFALTDATPISISGKDQGNGKFNQSADVDYILVKASKQVKVISGAGYATYCSPYALDFTDVTALTAYTASKDGSNVKFTKVTGSVPAGTGLLLKGETASIPVVASSSTDVSGNKLIGVLADTHVDKGAYVLMNASEGIGFYKTNNDLGFTVGAGTAYLPADVLAGARAFIGFDFDDEVETTGINEMKNVKANNAIYNLKGMKVKTAQKGLYIINGKKVVK